MTQHEAEFGQGSNEQSLSVSQAPIFPTLEQKSAKAAETLLMEHHLITLKYEIQRSESLIMRNTNRIKTLDGKRDLTVIYEFPSLNNVIR